jgi:hypothetical protein
MWLALAFCDRNCHCAIAPFLIYCDWVLSRPAASRCWQVIRPPCTTASEVGEMNAVLDKRPARNQEGFVIYISSF